MTFESVTSSQCIFHGPSGNLQVGAAGETLLCIFSDLHTQKVNPEDRVCARRGIVTGLNGAPSLHSVCSYYGQMRQEYFNGPNTHRNNFSYSTLLYLLQNGFQQFWNYFSYLDFQHRLCGPSQWQKITLFKFQCVLKCLWTTHLTLVLEDIPFGV